MRNSLLAAASMWMGSVLSPLHAQSRPNVLLVLVDDLGVEAMASYGATPLNAPTPTLDSLAANGVRFTNAHANPACTPTRVALQTGRHAFRTGIATTIGPGEPGIDAGERLLPVAIQGRGYAAAMIGKWHLGERFGIATPNQMGWPHFVGGIDGGYPNMFSWPKIVDGVQSSSTRYATTDEVDDSIAWIAAQTQPWLLHLAFHAPHAPFHAPPASLHSQNLAGLDPATTPIPFFKAMVEAMDRELGRLLASLPPAVRANTNVIVMGDNGTDTALTSLIGMTRGKGWLHQPGTHVPLVVSGPAVAARGRVETALVGVVDLFPTVLQMCGAPLPGPNDPRPIDGRSILPLLGGTATSVRDHVYVDMSISPFGGGYAIRTSGYELVRVLTVAPQHEELYDLAADPGEAANKLLRGTTSTDIAAYVDLDRRLAGIRSDGWVAGVGVGCPGSAGFVRLRAQTMPNVGAPFVLQVMNTSPTATGAFLGLGWNTSVGGSPLPLDLGAVGMPGCRLYTAMESAVPVHLTNGSYVGLPIVNSPTLLGAQAMVQAFVADPGRNAASLVATHGLFVRIGRQ